MRKSLFPLSLLVMTFGAALAMGCSHTQAQAADDGSGDEDQSDEPVAKKSDNNSSSNSSSSGSTAPANTTPTDSDAGAGAIDPDAGTTPTAPGVDTSMCAATSTVETEPNDTAAQANTFAGKTGSFCGSISSALDTDFVTFTLPAGTKGLGYALKFSNGGIGAVAVVNGQTFPLQNGLPLVVGAPYVVKITSTQPLAYRFELTVQ